MVRMARGRPGPDRIQQTGCGAHFLVVCTINNTILSPLNKKYGSPLTKPFLYYSSKRPLGHLYIGLRNTSSKVTHDTCIITKHIRILNAVEFCSFFSSVLNDVFFTGFFCKYLILRRIKNNHAFAYHLQQSTLGIGADSEFISRLLRINWTQSCLNFFKKKPPFKFLKKLTRLLAVHFNCYLINLYILKE